MTALTRRTSSGSRNTVCGFMRCATSAVSLCIAGSSAASRVRAESEFECALEVRRTLSGRFGKHEIGDGRHRPRRLDYRMGFGEEGRRQRGEAVPLHGRRLEQPAKQARLLGGHAHALTIDRVEPADRIGDRNQSARQALKAFEMPPLARCKAEPSDLAQRLGVPDRIVDRWRPQLPSISKEALQAPRRLSSCASPTLMIQRFPSWGNSRPPRLLCGTWGKVITPFQSPGASSGTANMAVE